MKYTHLFFDLDHTLWDFDTNSKYTLLELYDTLNLKEKGVDDFERFYRNYLDYNVMLWAKYRRGLIQQPELRVTRMRMALLDFKIGDEALALKMSRQYLEMLPTRTALFPYAMEILQYLAAKNYRLHLITNGFEEVQHHKIHYSGIRHFFDQIITSELSNCLKPDKAIFDFALQSARAHITESIMLGDDLEADIIGASQAGMDQVYINHAKKETSFRPTFMVHSLRELETIF